MSPRAKTSAYTCPYRDQEFYRSRGNQLAVIAIGKMEEMSAFEPRTMIQHTRSPSRPLVSAIPYRPMIAKAFLFIHFVPNTRFLCLFSDLGRTCHQSTLSST